MPSGMSGSGTMPVASIASTISAARAANRRWPTKKVAISSFCPACMRSERMVIVVRLDLGGLRADVAKRRENQDDNGVAIGVVRAFVFPVTG